MAKEKIKLFTEIGVGNSTFISTEKEYFDGREERVPGFQKIYLDGVYLRIWFGKIVILLSTKNGFKIQNKDKSTFKFLIGIQGNAFSQHT